MILLIDADSLMYAACYRKREHPEDDKYFQDIADARNKFDEQFMKIINDLEEVYQIDSFIVFSGARGNFRKRIAKSYKANRTQPLPPLFNQIKDYLVTQYDSIGAYGVETDDLVASYWKRLSDQLGRENVMIVSIDKDYKQLPALIYNYHYNHLCIYDVSEGEAIYNFYAQMIIGDSADNINYFKGKGVRFAEKYLADCSSNYSYTRAIYKLFIESYKSKARLKYMECFHLLKLLTNVKQ